MILFIKISACRYYGALEDIMNKKHFEDLDFAAVIVKEFYVFAKFISIVTIIGSVVGGVILWVRFSTLYGALLLFLGSLSGVMCLIVAWLSNIVLNCFFDSSRVTKELYESSKLNDVAKIVYIIFNTKEKVYASEITDDGIDTSADTDDAMLFETMQDTRQVVDDFGLVKNKGWVIKQTKI